VAELRWRMSYSAHRCDDKMPDSLTEKWAEVCRNIPRGAMC